MQLRDSSWVQGLQACQVRMQNDFLVSANDNLQTKTLQLTFCIFYLVLCAHKNGTSHWHVIYWKSGKRSALMIAKTSTGLRPTPKIVHSARCPSRRMVDAIEWFVLLNRFHGIIRLLESNSCVFCSNARMHRVVFNSVGFAWTIGAFMATIRAPDTIQQKRPKQRTPKSELLPFWRDTSFTLTDSWTIFNPLNWRTNYTLLLR